MFVDASEEEVLWAEPVPWNALPGAGPGDAPGNNKVEPKDCLACGGSGCSLCGGSNANQGFLQDPLQMLDWLRTVAQNVHPQLLNCSQVVPEYYSLLTPENENQRSLTALPANSGALSPRDNMDNLLGNLSRSMTITGGLGQDNENNDPVPRRRESRKQAEFLITVKKTLAKGKWMPAGMELDLTDEVHPLVCHILPGSIHNYNKQAPADEQIMPRDWVVEVNGVRDDAKAMYKRIQDDKTLEFQIRRTKPFTVTLNQFERVFFGKSLVGASKGMALMITSISDGVEQYNEKNPLTALKVTDRIVEVNGIAQDSKRMMQAIDTAAELKLVILTSEDNF
jgi:hypothetical protein